MENLLKLEILLKVIGCISLLVIAITSVLLLIEYRKNNRGAEKIKEVKKLIRKIKILSKNGIKLSIINSSLAIE